MEPADAAPNAPTTTGAVPTTPDCDSRKYQARATTLDSSIDTNPAPAAAPMSIRLNAISSVTSFAAAPTAVKKTKDGITAKLQLESVSGIAR